MSTLEAISPFQIVQGDRSTSVILNVGDYRADIFAERAEDGFEGNGYDWGSLATVFLEEKMPELIDIVRLDPEGSMFCAYSSDKQALETLLGAYADETAFTGRIRVHIIDPGATRTRMRALAFPGEEPESVKPPEVIGKAIVERLTAKAPTGERIRVDAEVAEWPAEA